VSGPDSSGEVEFVLLAKPDGLWVTLGSDHTDRKAETVFRMELEDPVRKRKLSHEYRISVLPVEG
jgi:hypothetical protein